MAKKFTVGDKIRVNNKNVQDIHNKTGTVLGYYGEGIVCVALDKQYAIAEKFLEKVIDDEVLTKQCLFENADAFDTPFVPMKKHTLTPEDLKRFEQAINEQFNKEGEEKKMKEIKNQEVVDLYFSRKKEVLLDEFDTTQKAIREIDNNHIFIKQLKDQFKEYIEKNEIKDVNINNFPTLNLTKESKVKYDEAYNDYNNKLDKLNNLKEEILALLSGCETYEQEMEILQTYKIVNYNTHYVSMNKIEEETN